jgi:hypothetical protein
MHPLAGARRGGAAAEEVARLEALARALGMAIERSRLPPAALLLNELLQMQARKRLSLLTCNPAAYVY